MVRHEFMKMLSPSVQDGLLTHESKDEALFSLPCFIEIIKKSGGSSMLMMCWFYCIPFAKGLFFAFAPLLVLFSLFALKRGIRQSRPGLRQWSFLLMFIALLKMTTWDLYLLREDILCGIALFSEACTAEGIKILQAAGLAALVLGSVLLFNLYGRFMHTRRQQEKTPDKVNIRFWANLAMCLVLLLILWLAAPWAGYLTVGHVPQIFMRVPWQHLAVLTIFVLLLGFWKLEDCRWVYNPREKDKAKKHHVAVWTPKDTLWVSVILFLFALAFSYASNDALSTSLPKKGEKSMHLQIDRSDLEELGRGFRRP
jgi:NADH:ubiquinone oxidoreductase subunit 5 (subunit L)/multisubunit Na+/H+ antiporter MnhA subunit